MRGYMNGVYRDLSAAEEADVNAAIAEPQPVGGVWTKVVEVTFTTETAVTSVERTGLENLTEIWIKAEELENDNASTANSLKIRINGTVIAGGFVTMQKTGSGTKYQNCHLIYDGLYWECTNSDPYNAVANISLANMKKINDAIDNIGPANRIKLESSNSSNAAGGTITVWGR